MGDRGSPRRPLNEPLRTRHDLWKQTLPLKWKPCALPNQCCGIGRKDCQARHVTVPRVVAPDRGLGSECPEQSHGKHYNIPLAKMQALMYRQRWYVHFGEKSLWGGTRAPAPGKRDQLHVGAGRNR